MVRKGFGKVGTLSQAEGGERGVGEGVVDRGEVVKALGVADKMDHW